MPYRHPDHPHHPESHNNPKNTQCRLDPKKENWVEVLLKEDEPINIVIIKEDEPINTDEIMDIVIHTNYNII